MTRPLPELLAPAGNPEMALAAFDAGADAVYLGLGSFSARARAENFTPDSLGRLVDFAHAGKRRVHLALNTLVKESELDAAAEELAMALRLGIDAVIVQDPGVIRMARRYFPGLELHASTQMGIHNPSGVEILARLGVRRVILERQMTLPEIAATQRTARRLGVEIEVFIHGSLCSSLSGRCLWSSWQGGDSGNRGRCKQPCRRSYGDAGFALSTTDLDGLELLDEFRRLGVASLKIEGRLRPPDYVWKSVRAYRIALDDPTPAGQAEARKLLDQTPARDPGYGAYRGNFDSMLAHGRFGVFGTPVGTVRQAGPKGLTVELENRIHLGDRLRLVPPDGGEGEAFTLTRLETAGRREVAARPGTRAFLPGEFTARAGFRLYKTGESNNQFAHRAATLPARREELELTVELDGGGVTVRSPLLPAFRQSLQPAPAEAHPLTAEQLGKVFAGGAPEPWRARVARAEVTGYWFLPVALQKGLRRDFWAWAAPLLTEIDPHPQAAEGLRRFRDEYRQPRTPVPQPAGRDDREIPGFIPALREAEWRERITAGGYRAAGWHALTWLSGRRDVSWGVVPPLPVCNSLAAAAFAELGADYAAWWPELDAEALRQLRERSPLPLVEPVPPPLLVTRARVNAETLVDGRGNRMRLRRDPDTGLTELLADYRPPREWH